MSDGFGILITVPGADVTDSPTAQVSMNTNNPFIKIDTQNDAGFRTTTLLITNDPPEPIAVPGGAHIYTTLYFFKHNYDYIPSLETLFFVSGPGASTANTQSYSQDINRVSTHTISDYADLYAVADATNVYFIVDKYQDILGFANNLSGTTVEITTHVFVEDIA